MLNTITLRLVSSPVQRCLSTSQVRCAGHNKWTKIKQKKGVNDASKSATYSRATQDILVAARVGGGVDPNTNATLAAALKHVKAQGVPKENIAKALEKAAKVKSVGETTIYEAIACNSVGMIIECVTDNSNRTVKSIREILTKRSARMAPVGFMFERGGVVRVKMNPGETSESLDAVTDTALLNGALDFEELPAESESGSEIKFYCAPSGLSQLTSALAQEPLVTLLASELEYNPSEKTPVSIEDTEVLEELLQTVEALDDVVRVWTTH